MRDGAWTPLLLVVVGFSGTAAAPKGSLKRRIGRADGLAPDTVSRDAAEPEVSRHSSSSSGATGSLSKRVRRANAADSSAPPDDRPESKPLN